MAFVEPVTFAARGIKLVPLELHHEAGLRTAAADGELDPSKENQDPMAIINEFQITPTICSSGQPTEDQFKRIASLGYDCVVNLAMPDHERSIDREGSIVTSLGMTYVHLPVPFDAPCQL